MNPGDYVAIGVSDTGTGMPADVVARASDPLGATTKLVGEGMAPALVDMHTASPSRAVVTCA